MRIPRYNSERLPSTEPAGVERRPSQVGQAISRLGKIGMNIAGKVADAENSRRVLQGKNAMNEVALESQRNIEQDTNLDGYEERHTEWLEDKLSGAIENETNPVVRRRLEQQKEKILINGIHNIKRLHHSKMLDNWNINVANEEARIKARLLETDDPVEKANLLQELHDTYQEGVDSLFWDKQAAENRLAEFAGELRESEIDRGLQENPHKFVKDVESGEHDYEFVSDEERREKLRDAKRLASAEDKRLDWIRTERYNETSISLGEALINNELTPDIVKQHLRDGNIDTDLAAVYHDAVTGDYDAPSSLRTAKPEILLSLLEDSIKEGTESHQIMEKAARALADGDLSLVEFGYFLSEAQKIAEGGRATTAWQKLYKFAERWGAGVVPGLLFHKYMERVQDDVEPNLAADGVIAETFYEKYPELERLEITPEEVEYTAGLHGITPEEVVRLILNEEGE